MRIKENRTEPPLRMRELPQVEEAESRLLLYGDDPHRVEDIIEKLSRELFGITRQETGFEIPPEYWNLQEHSPEWQRISELYDQYEVQFATGDHLTDDEAMEELSRLGLDFSDERGQPLRCTKLLARVAEAAARGIKGTLPDPKKAKLDQAEATLARDRDDFLAKKRRSQP